MIAKRRVIQLLATLAVVAAPVLAVGPGQTLTAFAAAPDGATSAAPAIPAGVSGTPSPAVAITGAESTTVISTNSAGDPCATGSFEFDLVQWPFNWPTLAWFKMTTYWCWNGVIVTYHNTREAGGVTSSGSAAGWSYTGIVQGSDGWYCYVAKGSHRNCSGNTEFAQGSFPECAFKVGCISSWNPQIQEWENYHGGFFHN
jgi:hypothetical protein